MNRILSLSVTRPKLIVTIMVIATLALALCAALPSLWPQTFSRLHGVAIDTDPENMLPEDEAVRRFHQAMKRELSLYDMIVLGVVNDAHPEGVFNPQSLQRIYELTEYAKTLNWREEGQTETLAGIIDTDVIAPSTVDQIEQAGLGAVTFNWLMPTPPTTQAEALAIRDKAARLPFLQGTMLSEDGKAIALYLPISSKDLSYTLTTKLLDKIASFSGDERYFITGLPVAEDTFGVEMFKQMAISAPLAMAIIFALLFYFFRKLVLIIAPMIVAMVSVIMTMALLVITGQTIHIMSSMIPIFIMPIAVLDAVHILSEFFDRYQETRDRQQTLSQVMDTLFVPMLYTSLTTAAGFASLALTPIPPVQVFGVFVACGVLIAWWWTITLIPAYIMLIRPESLDNFGLGAGSDTPAEQTRLTRLLVGMGAMTYRRAKAILIATAAVLVVALYGVFHIVVNDNPVNWFEPSHPIRVADRVLNEHFGGTYMAYLALEAPPDAESPGQYAGGLKSRLNGRAEALKTEFPEVSPVFATLQAEIDRLSPSATSKVAFLEQLETFAEAQADKAAWEQSQLWSEALLVLSQERQRGEVFKQPEVLTYMAQLENHLLQTGMVGKSNSLASIVKTVHRELMLGEAEQFKIPASVNAVGQCLLTWQSSHRPQDLWHFVTPDYRKTSIWVQLTSGDNRDMADLVQAVERFMTEQPPPQPLVHQWFGLTYINMIWQEKMVHGMRNAFLGSFVVVLIMMIILFRSIWWGVLSMLPLTITIVLIYGIIGLIGKEYDMPVAVLSSLSLGLAVDYAIHFLARSRSLQPRYGSWAQTVAPVFGEPARAIVRNALVVGIGFLPLIAAPLVPYQTVGIFIAAILLIAGAASLFILPALLTCLEKQVFPQNNQIQDETQTASGSET